MWELIYLLQIQIVAVHSKTVWQYDAVKTQIASVFLLRVKPNCSECINLFVSKYSAN